MSENERWPGLFFELFEVNTDLLAWSAALSIVLFVGSLVLMPVLIAKMRADYFVTPVPSSDTWLGRHPIARTVVHVLKNALGALLLVAGLFMIVLPGQGIITILAALSLLEFPGKRGLELMMIRQRHVGGAINWIRQKAGAPPVKIP